MPEKAACAKKQSRVQRALLRLQRLEQAGKCQVLYGDESGFCLSPLVPYLWQPRGKTVGLPAKAHSRRLNVLGFLSRSGRLHSLATRAKITAQFVIESIEALLPVLWHPTVLVLDNATVHRSRLVQAKRQEWKQKGLRLLFLPPYSPHLNLIEILWRQIKYRWLTPEAYINFETLCQSVTDVLTNVGTKYRLYFG